MILRVKKRNRSHLKINKWHGMVMFVYKNEVNYYARQPLKAHAQYKKLPSIK